MAGNQETADEDSSNTEPTGDTEQTDGDSENIENQETTDDEVNQDKRRVILPPWLTSDSGLISIEDVIVDETLDDAKLIL